MDPTDPAKVAGVFGTRVAETILASVHVRARQQAGHMDASDLIKTLQKDPCEEGAVHIWVPVGADRDPRRWRAFSVRSATYAEISRGPTSELIHNHAGRAAGLAYRGKTGGPSLCAA